jgi:pimeloyl-ACP methyl ester carboxylesterase
MKFSSHYLACEGREIHYTQWGAEHPSTVIAWHGLARTGRDMDEIAAHLASRFRVICPDTIGRGLSQWSPAPEKEYCLDFYARLAVSLVDQLGIRELHWLGTSMGGAIGIQLAAGALKGPHPAADPERHRAKARRIGGQSHSQLCRQPAAIRPAERTGAVLPRRIQALWLAVGRAVAAPRRNLGPAHREGKWTPHYDPKMVMQFTGHPGDYDQWPRGTRSTCRRCACAANL